MGFWAMARRTPFRMVTIQDGGTRPFQKDTHHLSFAADHRALPTTTLPMERGAGVNRSSGAQLLLQRVVAVRQKVQYPSAPHTWRTGLHRTGMDMLSLQACLGRR